MLMLMERVTYVLFFFFLSKIRHRAMLNPKIVIGQRGVDGVLESVISRGICMIVRVRVLRRNTQLRPGEKSNKNVHEACRCF